MKKLGILVAAALLAAFGASAVTTTVAAVSAAPQITSSNNERQKPAEYVEAENEAQANGFDSVVDYAMSFFKKKKWREAFKYLSIAEDESVDTYEPLGDLYYYGRAVKKDFQKAFMYYSIAGDQAGSSSALVKQARMYSKGEGCVCDLGLARFVAQKASEAGNDEGTRLYEELMTKWHEVGERIGGAVVFEVTDGGKHGWMVSQESVHTASAAVIASAMLTGCSGSSSGKHYLDNADYIAVRIEKDGNWSFMNSDHEIVCEDEFKEEPSVVYNGLFSVKENDGYSLYKIDGGKPKLIDGCEGLKCVGTLEDGVIPAVFPNERISLLDKNGKKVVTLEPVNGKEIVSIGTKSFGGLFTAKNEDGKWGYINTKGEVVIDFKYDGEYNSYDGYAVAYVVKDGEREYTVFNKKREIAFKVKKGYDPSGLVMHDLLIAKDNNDRVVFLNTKGEVVSKLPQKVVLVGDFTEDVVVFGTSDGLYGVMDMEGNVIVRAKYDEIHLVEGGNKFIVKDKDYCAIFNAKGDEEFRIDDFEKGVEWMGKFGLVGHEKNTYTFLDKDGKAIKNCDFYELSDDLCEDLMIHSDYIDIAGIANTIAGMITDKGVGKWSLGDAPGKYLSNPGDYLYKSGIELEDLKKEGYRYEIKVSVGFTGTIADYSYDGPNYSRREYWNPVEVYGFKFYVESEGYAHPLGYEWGNAMAKALTDKGFKVLKATKAENERNYFVVLMRKGDLLLYVYTEKDSRHGIIEFVKYSEEGAVSLKNQISQINGEEAQETARQSAEEAPTD